MVAFSGIKAELCSPPQTNRRFVPESERTSTICNQRPCPQKGQEGRSCYSRRFALANKSSVRANHRFASLRAKVRIKLCLLRFVRVTSSTIPLRGKCNTYTNLRFVRDAVKCMAIPEQIEDLYGQVIRRFACGPLSDAMQGFALHIFDLQVSRHL